MDSISLSDAGPVRREESFQANRIYEKQKTCTPHKTGTLTGHSFPLHLASVPGGVKGPGVRNRKIDDHQPDPQPFAPALFLMFPDYFDNFTSTLEELHS